MTLMSYAAFLLSARLASCRRISVVPIKPLLRRLPYLEEHHLHVGSHLGGLAVLADEEHQPVRLRELVLAEGDDRALRSGIDLLDVGAPAIGLDRGDLEEIADFVRQHAEAVAHLGGEIVDLLVGLEIGEPPVQRQPHREIVDVILGDQHRHADGDLRRPAIGGRLHHAGLEVEDRLLQHRLIELEADFLDVAGLLLAEQIAGAADIEVVRGELEARAQRLQRLQHFQPPLGLRRDLLLRRQREQRIGAQLRAPDPAAQLIELRQPEHVGAVHDQRVGGRDIEAGLDDRGRKQDVVFAVSRTPT